FHPRERRHRREPLQGSGAEPARAARIRALSRRLNMLAAFLALVVTLGCATPQVARQAPDPPASDLLNGGLGVRRWVEFKASAPRASALARTRPDQARADSSWPGAPREQTGAYQSLPPAVILDVDETILDNSGYQAWMALRGTSFDPKTW